MASINNSPTNPISYNKNHNSIIIQSNQFNQINKISINKNNDDDDDDDDDGGVE